MVKARAATMTRASLHNGSLEQRLSTECCQGSCILIGHQVSHRLSVNEHM